MIVKSIAKILQKLYNVTCNSRQIRDNCLKNVYYYKKDIMMISSVDGSSAISYTSPQASGDSQASVQLKKTSKTSGAKGANTNDNHSANNTVQRKLSNDNTGANHLTADKTTTDKQSSEIDYAKKKNGEDLALKYGQKDEYEEDYTYTSNNSDVPTSFAQLAAMVGSNTSTVTKEQLSEYLSSLTTGETKVSAAEITVVKNLIAQFDALSSGSGVLTSIDGLKEAQDYKTITKEQVTSPVDVRV